MTPSPSTSGRATWPSSPRGFTLVELLIVIVIIGLLVALLVPAITGAVRRAKDAAVTSEIQELAQALADFKSRYGDYPPSRVLLSESCNYAQYFSGGSTALPTTTGVITDINTQQLVQRSLVALRKFFPRVNFSTTSRLFKNGDPVWYDFNGNGVMDSDYTLDGRECLVFFLGGIPQYDVKGGSFTGGMAGFGRNPTNPFSNGIVGNPMYSNNRQPPMFEFRGARLQLIAGRTTGVPGYGDTMSSANAPAFFAYFSAYGGGAYDPNDVNVAEQDDATGKTLALSFRVQFPTYAAGSTTPAGAAVSPAPNPYTSTLSFSTATGSTTYLNPQSFQIISPGSDLAYGVGGRYNNTGRYAPGEPATPVPPDPASVLPAFAPGEDSESFRGCEADNLTNFARGRLGSG